MKDPGRPHLGEAACGVGIVLSGVLVLTPARLSLRDRSDEESGLERRFAFAVLDRPWATRSPARVLFAVALVTTAISLVIGNTATPAVGTLTSPNPAA